MADEPRSVLADEHVGLLLQDVESQAGLVFDEDLEAATLQIVNHLLKEAAAYHKETAHRIAHTAAADRVAHLLSHSAQEDPRCGELPHAAAHRIARSHHKIQRLEFELGGRSLSEDMLGPYAGMREPRLVTAGRKW